MEMRLHNKWEWGANKRKKASARLGYYPKNLQLASHRGKATGRDLGIGTGTGRNCERKRERLRSVYDQVSVAVDAVVLRLLRLGRLVAEAEVYNSESERSRRENEKRRRVYVEYRAARRSLMLLSKIIRNCHSSQ
jgi:hypothetical protein